MTAVCFTGNRCTLQKAVSYTHLIRTVSEIYFSGAAIAEHRDGIRISKGDAKLYYVMKTVQVENL